MRVHVRVTVNLLRLHYSLRVLMGIEYLGARELGGLLGIDRRAAGRLLSMMEKIGLAIRWSRSYYRLVPYSQVGRYGVYESDNPDWDSETIALSIKPLTSDNSKNY